MTETSMPDPWPALRLILGFSCLSLTLSACDDGATLRRDAGDPREGGAEPDSSLGPSDASQTPAASAHEAGATLDAGADAALDSGLPADAAGDAARDGGLDAAEPALQVSVLRETTLDSGVSYQLLRLQRGDGAASYAQWFPPPDGGLRPVVIATKPYDGIDWTGEALDARWAKLGRGLHPDLDGPKLADGGAPENPISYEPLAPELVEDAALYRAHNFGTLLLYGRFYAGGDVQNDIDDMTLGFDFLAQAAQVDKKRIGILGGSWGGFEALYGAAYARDDVKPRVGVGLSPLSDFEREEAFVTRELPMLYAQPASDSASATFFEPYLRRMHQTTSARGGYAGLRAQDLVARIHAPFLLVHEDWDTLVSFDQSTRLVQLGPDVFSPLWILHSTAPPAWDQVLNGHGPLLTQFAQLASYTFVTAFLLRHLADPDQTVYAVWDTVSMRMLFAHMHGLQRAGVDVRFFVQRLLELTDPRITAIDFSSGASDSAAANVARELNLEWKTQYTAANVAAQLAAGLPAP
jgi:pimeloyl-ACP methyl ester carboxylesterase